MVAAAVAGPAAAQDGFSDVADGVHKPAIDALSQQGIFEGTLCGDDMFCPQESIKRSTMAVWLIRALGEQPATAGETRFADVDASDWQAPYIERLAQLEITVGCKQEPLRYCGDTAVSRAQMATFLVRAYNLSLAEPAGFADTEGSVHTDSIDRLAAAGITAGCKLEPLRYCPSQQVTRAQMATFLNRATNTTPTRTDSTRTDHGYKAIAAGGAHSCAIATDDTITCWGANRFGQIEAPQGTFRAISAAGANSCAIASDDTITCWGWNEYGQANAPAGTYKTISTGIFHNCAIASDDTITCWGRNDDGQTDAPASTHKSIAAGLFFSCAIASDDTITCWGRNQRGQTDAPTGTYKTIAAGGSHSCAIASDDTITCWGWNENGQANAP